MRHRAVDELARLRRAMQYWTYSRDVLEQRLEIDLLLVVAPSEVRFCWPTIATTGTWSSFAS